MKYFGAVFFVLTFVVVSAQLLADWNSSNDPEHFAVSSSAHETVVNTDRAYPFANLAVNRMGALFYRGFLAMIVDFWVKKLKNPLSQRLEDTVNTVDNLKYDSARLKAKFEENAAETKATIERLTAQLNAFRCSCSADDPTSIGKIPSSCAELKAIGYKKSGLYSVKGTRQVEKVYCDFTQPSDGPNFQNWIGYEDVKSTPVYFYVQKITTFSTLDTPIPFEIEMLNTGSAMDIGTGKFTAPVKGIYFFTFAGLANYPASGTAFNYMQVKLLLNGNLIGTAQINEANVVSFTYGLSPVTLQSTLHLEKGDQIWLQIGDISTNGVLFDSAYHSTHFTGLLIEEDLFN